MLQIERTAVIPNTASLWTFPYEVGMYLLGIWGIGAIGFAVWQIYVYRRFVKKVYRSLTPISSNDRIIHQLHMLRKTLGIRSNVQMAYSTVVHSPVLVGLRRPTIFFPTKIPSNANLSMIIHHELIHLKRKDLWLKALVLLVGSLHWFNPLVHMLRKDIHIWSELACDEEVVTKMTHSERKRYGETIMSVMMSSSKVPVRFSASLSDDGKKLQKRLNLMLGVSKIKKRIIIITTLAIMAVGTISVASAVWASKHIPVVEADTKLAKITTRTSIKSEGVIERELSQHQHEKKQFQP
ncbi:M56 family metallopeptidase [Fontibacillus panacisegetis]|nr:M56 family metallopeptidase [Fontibacillus panacisegetis]